jgi:hypothetical protein
VQRASPLEFSFRGIALKAQIAELRKEKRRSYATVGDDTKDAALEILAERPGISGAELGRTLGKSESLGRKLRRELLPIVNGAGTGLANGTGA